MEESEACSGSQHNEHLDHFLRFGINTPPTQECLTHITELPQEFRNAIDKGHSTGWRCIDNFLQGIRPGELTVITADTGAGKTTFCTQLVINCARLGVPVWINSWEMKPATIMRKLASIILKRPLKFQAFTTADSALFDEWGRKYAVYVNPNTIGTDINSLAQQLVKAKELGMEIVMLDHLDYLLKGRRENQHEVIEETMKRLHELCFALSMHFLLICHPKQTTAITEEVGMNSLKGSASIKQYADNVICLHRCARTDPQADPNKVKIRIAKNRQFGIEGVTYLFYQPLWDGYQELNDFQGEHNDEAQED